MVANFLKTKHMILRRAIFEIEKLENAMLENK